MVRPVLPIDEIREALCETLRRPGQNVVVVAPPGAGKTTTVPAIALEECTGEVWVSQPRRIAARAAASIVARWRGERLGETVGVRVRFGTEVSRSTRLSFVTEGLLLRRIRDDTRLAGIDIVILDELHERHLSTDLVLGLARDIQRTHRPDLRIVFLLGQCSY